MNTKISKVIFVHQNVQKSNIDVAIATPVKLGTIEVPDKKKPYPKKDGPKPLFWDNFPISEWRFYLDIANKANKVLGFATVTLSKKARIAGELNEDFGSIWFTCGSKAFKDNFRRPLAIALECNGLREMRKDEILKMKPGFKFNILWINDRVECDLIDCEKEAGKTDLVYSVIGSDIKYKLSLDLVESNGKGRYQDEDFIFLVSDSVENI